MWRIQLGRGGFCINLCNYFIIFHVGMNDELYQSPGCRNEASRAHVSVAGDEDLDLVCQKRVLREETSAMLQIKGRSSTYLDWFTHDCAKRPQKQLHAAQFMFCSPPAVQVACAVM